MGSVEHSKDLLNKIDRGMHNSLADSLMQKLSGQPSGPGDLVGFSCVSLSNTMAGVTVISVNIELQLSSWYWGAILLSEYGDEEIVKHITFIMSWSS